MALNAGGMVSGVSDFYQYLISSARFGLLKTRLSGSDFTGSINNKIIFVQLSIFGLVWKLGQGFYWPWDFEVLAQHWALVLAFQALNDFILGKISTGRFRSSGCSWRIGQHLWRVWKRLPGRGPVGHEGHRTCRSLFQREFCYFLMSCQSNPYKNSLIECPS